MTTPDLYVVSTVRIDLHDRAVVRAYGLFTEQQARAYRRELDATGALAQRDDEQGPGATRDGAAHPSRHPRPARTRCPTCGCGVEATTPPRNPGGQARHAPEGTKRLTP